jgi:phosphatidylserine decarboxylase
VTAVRSLLLTLLPKVALSRLTGLATRIPLPRSLRGPAYRWFAGRYGANLAEMAGNLADYPSLAAFFRRPLRPGARPVASAPLVWPCDGKVVTAGPVAGARVPQVKGRDYALADLLGDVRLAGALADGTQATVYLAPGDYHRVHSPFAGRITSVRPIGGTLFPVNPPAVRSVRDLFVRNARHVFAFELPDGREAAVVLVGALNVGDTLVTAQAGTTVRAGDELGQFGFGSTAIVVLARGSGFAPVAAETRTVMGAPVPIG